MGGGGVWYDVDTSNSNNNQENVHGAVIIAESLQEFTGSPVSSSHEST